MRGCIVRRQDKDLFFSNNRSNYRMNIQGIDMFLDFYHLAL